MTIITVFLILYAPLFFLVFGITGFLILVSSLDALSEYRLRRKIERARRRREKQKARAAQTRALRSPRHRVRTHVLS